MADTLSIWQIFLFIEMLLEYRPANHNKPNEEIREKIVPRWGERE